MQTRKKSCRFELHWRFRFLSITKSDVPLRLIYWIERWIEIKRKRRHMRQAIIRWEKLSRSIGNLYNTLSMTPFQQGINTCISNCIRQQCIENNKSNNTHTPTKSISRKCLRSASCVFRIQFVCQIVTVLQSFVLKHIYT